MAESVLSQIGDFTLIDDSFLSHLNGVIFHHVLPVYNTNEPLKCIYSITDVIEPHISDVIGLFKVGWVSPSDVLSSIPAKLPLDNNKTFLSTVFEAHQLPCDPTEMYQFGYITKEGVVGASTPFALESNDLIAVEDPTDPGLLVFKTSVSQLKDQLHQLSDEKQYYASKYEVLQTNFSKLKSEFDKLELELKLEKENAEQLENEKKILAAELQQIKEHSKSETLLGIDDDILADAVNNTTPEKGNSNICFNTEIIGDIVNSKVWDSLYEVYEVALEISQALKSKKNLNMSYEALIEYIIDVFNMTKKIYKVNEPGENRLPKHCRCYYEQKKYCCTRWCTEAQFQYMMAQPLYTIFSNCNHFTECGATDCDGSFDPTSLSDYIVSMKELSVTKETNVEPNTFKEANFESNAIKEANLKPNAIPVSDTDVEQTFVDDQIEPENCIDTISKLTDERDKVIVELNQSKEKIAILNSRVNVLELELASQQNKSVSHVENLHKKRNFSSSGSFIISDLESILESVYNEYSQLKKKFDDLCKQNSRNKSLELRFALLQQENRALHSYLNQAPNQRKQFQNNDIQSEDINKLLLEKEAVQAKLFNLQKESVGKISPNLLQQ